MPLTTTTSRITRFVLLAGLCAGICAAGDLPYLPDELVPAFEPGLPKQLPKPAFTGAFRRLPAGDGFVWLADVAKGLDKGNKLAFRMTFDAEIKAEQVGFVAIRARTVRAPGELAGEERPGRVRIHVARRDDMSQTALYHLAKIGREWDWHYYPFRARVPIAADAGTIRFSFDLQPQAIEIEEVRLYVATEGFDMSRLPMMSAGYQGRAPDAAWRKEAEERILKHRTGTLEVRVTDAVGNPVPDARVAVSMLRHAFDFGSTFKSKYLDGSEPNAVRYRETFDELFSALVPTPMLIPRHTPNMHKGTHANQQLLGLGRVLQWATDRHMSLRGHTLVWANLQPWSNELVAQGNPKGILDYIRDHQRYVFSLTKGTIREWDAINHPIRFQKDLRDIFGENIYRDLIARQRGATDAVLIVNEALFDNAREDAFYDMMAHLQQDERSKADGAGFQSHFTVHNIRGMEDLWRRYERFAKLVDRLVVTEYDFVCNDDQLHAEYLRDILTLSFSHPKMTGFINWGFWAGEHWKPEGALIREDWTERPAVSVWRDLVKGRWWTTGRLKTNARGEAGTRAFYGVYEISVYPAGTRTTQVIHHRPGSKTAELEVP